VLPLAYIVTAMMFYDGQEELDNLVWDKNDDDTEAAQKQLRLTTFCQKVEDFRSREVQQTSEAHRTDNSWWIQHSLPC
jgi:hypothetical protein